MLDLQREGRIQRIGLSGVTVEQLDVALGQTEIVTVSNLYSVVDRRDDMLVERCEREGIAYLPWFPLGGGHLGGGSRTGAAQVVEAVARSRGVTPMQVALAWLLRRSPVLAPIPGTSRVVHLEENVAATSLHLDAGELAQLG